MAEFPKCFRIIRVSHIERNKSAATFSHTCHIQGFPSAAELRIANCRLSVNIKTVIGNVGFFCQAIQIRHQHFGDIRPQLVAIVAFKCMDHSIIGAYINHTLTIQARHRRNKSGIPRIDIPHIRQTGIHRSRMYNIS